MSKTGQPTHAEIMRAFAQWDTALREKDLDALERCYFPNVVVYDIGTQLVGFDKLRAFWEGCFPYFPNPIGCERKDVRIQASADIAVATFLSRMSGMESDHPSARAWIRSTICFRRLEGEWRIFHEHASFPVDCGAEKPTYIFDEA
jgi:ketosteroid isomerase-like protein